MRSATIGAGTVGSMRTSTTTGPGSARAWASAGASSGSRSTVKPMAPWQRAKVAKSVRGSWVSTGVIPSAVMPCWLSPSWASLRTIHTTRRPYATAVLISLFINIAPSPTTATTGRSAAAAAPMAPALKCPIEPQAALVR